MVKKSLQRGNAQDTIRGTLGANYTKAYKPCGDDDPFIADTKMFAPPYHWQEHRTLRYEKHFHYPMV
jgi:hypothetical protein